MPFSRPKFSQIDAQVTQDLIASNPGSKGLLRFSSMGVLGRVLAKLSHGLYGYLDYVSRQSVPYTADGENLAGWGALRGVTREPATVAQGTVLFSAQAGTHIPAGTIVRRTSDQVAYTADQDSFAVAQPADANGRIGYLITVSVTSLAFGGLANSPSGTAMTIGGGVAGVTSSGYVATALTGGSDVEDDASLRQRVLAAFANPIQGGAARDYVRWCNEVPGVSRVWVNPRGAGAGSVVVYAMKDVANASNNGFLIGTNGVATNERRGERATGDQLTIADHLDLTRPVTALVTVVTPNSQLQSVTIKGVSQLPQIKRDAIAAAIRQMLIAACDPLGTAIYPSQFETAISSVPDVGPFVMSEPAAIINPNFGSLLVLDQVNYLP